MSPWYLGIIYQRMEMPFYIFGENATFLNYFVWLRITDEGSVPDMRIWSTLLITFDLKWCIYLSRSLYSYFRPFEGIMIDMGDVTFH